MSYLNANTVLPPALLRELQKYVQGSLVYVPRPSEEQRRHWGERNGTRRMLDLRNEKIRREKSGGKTIEVLADEYGMTPDGIRKVLYGRERGERRTGTAEDAETQQQESS